MIYCTKIHKFLCRGSDRGEGDKRTRVDEDQATTNPEAQRSKTVKEAKETRR